MNWNDRDLKPRQRSANYSEVRKRVIDRLERDKAAFFASGGKVKRTSQDYQLAH